MVGLGFKAIWGPGYIVISKDPWYDVRPSPTNLSCHHSCVTSAATTSYASHHDHLAPTKGF